MGSTWCPQLLQPFPTHRLSFLPTALCWLALIFMGLRGAENGSGCNRAGCKPGVCSRLMPQSEWNCGPTFSAHAAAVQAPSEQPAWGGSGGSCRCLLGCRAPLNPKCWSRVLLTQDSSEEGNVFPKSVEPLEKEVANGCEIDLQPCFQALQAAVPKPDAGFLSGALPEMCAVWAPTVTCGVDGSTALRVNRNFLPALLGSQLSAAYSASAPGSRTKAFLSHGTQ